MTPNKKRIQQWVNALRSGNYQQGQGALRSEDTYCCLGVACDVSGLGKWRRNPGGGYYTHFYYDSIDTLPDVVANWYGLTSTDPTVITREGNGPGAQGKLTSLNDTRGYTFERIADAIERTYLK